MGRAYWELRAQIDRRSEPVRSFRELGLLVRRSFREERATAAYRAAYSEPDPLVSICISTYNRADLLFERSLRSSLAQTYKNIEVIVVGDCCTDQTVERMARVRDPRVTFVNLPRRGDYPADPDQRWMVAGTSPVNFALLLARGQFITHLDDDDEHTPDRVTTLVKAIKDSEADLLFHPFRFEAQENDWRVNEAKHFQKGSVTTSSIFYHRWFARIGWDPFAYRYGEPGDWNRLRKIHYLGARVMWHEGLFLNHYRERANRSETG